jgi:prepilin-type N-terminal cleavage/methylation domain-containing protein
MPKKRGITLMEIIIVLMIISILAIIAVPTYVSYTQQGEAKAALNNLISIYHAERTHYFGPNGAYCTNVAANCPGANCCDNLTDINTNLVLNVTDAYFTYACTNAGGFQCKATNVADTNLILTVSGNVPLVLVGGTGCASFAGANCNPSCATDVTLYCPTSN